MSANMSAKLSTKTMLTLAAVATLGAAALSPTSASAMSRSSMNMMSKMVVKSDDLKSPGYCGYPPCPRPHPVFVRSGNRANAGFGN